MPEPLRGVGGCYMRPGAAVKAVCLRRAAAARAVRLHGPVTEEGAERWLVSTTAHGYDAKSYLEQIMSCAKIAITIDEDLLARLDRMVSEQRFPNRSRASAGGPAR